MQEKNKIKHLNTLRFFAAFMVILSHVELVKSFYGITNHHNEIGFIAGVGVDIFFALSGFLITYLLLQEQAKNHGISIKNFYFRRIFRIWPLYFVILTLTTIAEISNVDSILFQNFNSKSLTLNLLFLPQLSKALYTNSLSNSILWSIGIEELFYLFFPWIFRLLRSRLLKNVLLLTAWLALLKWIAMILISKYASNALEDHIIRLLSMTRFENLLIGSVFGVLAYNFSSRTRKKIILLSSIFVLVYLFKSWLNLPIVPIASINPPTELVANSMFVSTLSAIVIYFITCTPQLQKVREYDALNYLGKISYGIYVWHCLVIAVLVIVFPNILELNYLFTLIIAVMTIIIASMSYRFIEKPFLSRSQQYRS